jgi:lauroyl/myristoyl acyltransferase
MKDSLENFRSRILNPSPEERKKASYSLALFSANIKRFLPAVQADDYEEMYRNVIYYQKKSGVEQSDLKYLRETKVINKSRVNLESVAVSENTVFATFHLGSYRLMNCYLYEQGYKVVLIIDDSVYHKQQEEMLRVCRDVLQGKSTSEMVILNIKDRRAIFQLKQLIEEGYVMSVYLDGNSAMVDKEQDFSKSFIPIRFLEQEIFVKNGVGKLAALLNARIIPVVSFRDESDSNNIEFYEEIKMDDFATRDDFAVRSIEIAYRKLEEKLVEYPEQWECWLYIHKWFMRDVSVSFDELNKVEGCFNRKRYTTFFLGESIFLFDLLDYRSYPIDNKLYEALRKNDFGTIKPDFLRELKIRNVIV